jgi:linoleoyl-CoA desaturase
MQTLRFAASPSFYNDLRQRVNAYFTEANLATTGNWWLYSKAIILILTCIISYVTVVFFTPETTWIALSLCVILGIATAGIGFNVMHDGSHGSFSTSRGLNKAAAFTLSLLGGSHFMWNLKHNTVHHTFTNVDGVDDDIDLRPFLRMCSTQKHLGIHRFQHLYFGVLYGTTQFFWMFWLDFKKYFRGRIGNIPLTKDNMKPLDHAIFWAGKFLCYFLFIGLPIITVGLVPALIGYGVFVAVTGFIISLVFQLAHAVEHADFPIPNDVGQFENEWAIHQVQSTANFATSNRIVTWFCGGLNFQIEHHLFPKVSHVHYPQISRIVRETCLEHNLHYIEFPHMTAAVQSHYRYLRELGRA